MKKKMFIAGMSLAVALVLLATASFAFITLSTAPEVKGMQMTLSTGRTLLLAPGNGTNTAPAASEFSQYISLSSDFAGLAPLRPVSTADGVNWYLPAYNTEDGTIGEISEFILDDTLEHGNVSLLDANGNYLTEGELRQASANGYYVYADFWMKTEEDGAKVRLSIPHLYGTAEERHSGTVSEYGLGAEELQSAVYGTYVLGEPELDESDSTKLAVRTEEPETALRLGFLVYQDTETLEPITSGIGADGIPDGTVKLPFKIYEPNADKRAAGTAQELLIPDAAGSAVAIRDDYIAGSSYSDLSDNTYYVTQPIAKTADGGIELTTVPVEDMIVQLKSEWDNTSVIKTLSGQWGNSILKANSNDVKTFGQFLKTEVFLTMANQPVPVSAEAGMTDIAGSNVIVELDKKTPIRVRLFVWLEGQDVDCWNDIAAGTFRINLELAGESVYKGENYKPEKDAEPEEPEEPITMCTLRRDWLTMAEAGINKFYVESVEFTKTAPKNYTKKWNAGTEDGSKAIYAYEYGRRIYVVVPSGQDKIYFPEDSSELFFKLEHCTSMTGFQYVDTSNVTNMSSMFRACNAVKSLDLTSFNTEKVSSMIGMFWETFNLSTLDVSSFRTPSLVFMGGMFYRTGACELDLSGFDISNVDSLGNVFVECEDLQTIYVGSGWTQPNYAYCPNVFKRCHSLVGGNGTAYDPAHVDYTYARIDTAETPGYLTDKNAITVITCTLKGYGTDGNSSDGWFDSTAAGITRNQITALEFVKSVPTGYTATWNASAETGVQEIDAYLKGTTVSIVIPDGADRIYLPYNSAEIFKGLTACTSIDGTTYLDTSRPYNMFRMFAYCSNLTNVDVSNWDTSNVKTMTSMFDSCQKLKTVYGGSGWDISNDTSGADMFKDCVSLVGGNGTPYSSSYTDKTYARIDTAETPGYFTEKSQNEVEDLTLKPELTWLFDRQYKGNIETVTFSKTAPASHVTTWRADNGSGPVGLTGYASGDVYGFDITIVIPEGADRLYFPADSSNLFSTMTVLNAINGLDLVDTSGVTDMSGMFSNIDDLRVLNLSGWDTSNVTNMAGMFEMATSLTTVYVGDKWSTESVPNGQNLFSGNRWLVGGNGTKYDANHVDKTYARIDTAETPGYFTAK